MNRIVVMLLAVNWLTGAALLTGCNDDQALLAELNDPAPVKRAGAVRLLWKRGGEQAYRLANRALADRSAIVRVAAVRALADFKDRDTTAALIRSLRDGDPEVRQEAIRALGRRRSPQSQQALVGLLERGESSSDVVRQAEQVLHDWGISPARLAELLVARRLERIQQAWPSSQGQQRALLVRRAGHLASAAALPLVLQGLSDADGAVVQAALEVLDGRGGEQALRRLVTLSASDSPGLRASAVAALARMGRAGLEVIAGRLRDNDDQVRLAALRALVESQADFDGTAACQLLLEADLHTTRQVAGLLRRAKRDCPAQTLQAYLRAHPQQPEALQVVAELSSPTARQVLAAASYHGREGYWRDAALVLAGAGDKKLAASLARRLRLLDKLVRERLASWPGTQLAPLQAEAPVDDTRLSKKQLETLYKKYHLQPRPGSPRGVADLLAPFRKKGGTADSRIFDPLGPRLRAEVTMLFRALVRLDREHARDLAAGFLTLDDSELLVPILQEVFATGNDTVQFSTEQLARLGWLLEHSSAPAARVLAEVLAQAASDGTARILARVLAAADWEKREAILSGLSAWKAKTAILQPALAKLLKGDSAASAARLLARLGAKSQIPMLKAALARAGPAEELQVLQALAELSDHSILPRLEQLLRMPDPRIRLKAVEILASLSGQRARVLLERASFDIDRRVRQAATDSLHRVDHTR